MTPPSACGRDLVGVLESARLMLELVCEPISTSSETFLCTHGKVCWVHIMGDAVKLLLLPNPKIQTDTGYLV